MFIKISIVFEKGSYFNKRENEVKLFNMKNDGDKESQRKRGSRRVRVTYINVNCGKTRKIKRKGVLKRERYSERERG